MKSKLVAAGLTSRLSPICNVSGRTIICLQSIPSVLPVSSHPRLSILALSALSDWCASHILGEKSAEQTIYRVTHYGLKWLRWAHHLLVECRGFTSSEIVRVHMEVRVWYQLHAQCQIRVRTTLRDNGRVLISHASCSTSGVACRDSYKRWIETHTDTILARWRPVRQRDALDKLYCKPLQDWSLIGTNIQPALLACLAVL